MQTILGSGGAIGFPLANVLNEYTDKIRLVSRRPIRVNKTDELCPVDLTDFTNIDKAIEGSEVVYVTVGFKYNLKVWQNTWPGFMQAVINACKKHNARLVFLDNIYMYDALAIPFMTEESFINAPSKKGKIRQQLHEMIMGEVANNNLTALIARSADFYGPYNNNSLLGIMVIDKLLKGKKAQVFGDANKIHTFTYTPDAAKAAALLGNTPDAFNQVWHLPTTKEKLTMADWVTLVAYTLKVEPKIQKVPKWMIQMLGLFIPVMREFPEMLYQNDRDYIFNSSKFENRFGWLATSPISGVMTTIEQMKNSQL